MRRALGQLTLTVSGSGLALTQLVIRRGGRRGALVAEAVSAGLLVRDVAMIATGVPRRLSRGPAVLLYAEAGAAAIATGAGLRAMGSSGLEDARKPGWKVPPGELVRRLAVGTLFGLHTVRFRIYLSPGSGRRPSAADQTDTA